MAETRSKSFVYLIGEPVETFCGRVLPTSSEVLKVYFHYHKTKKLSQKDAIKHVVSEIRHIWACARVPTCEEKNISRKLDSLLGKYRSVCRNKLRGGLTQAKKEAEFQKTLDILFDISHHEAFDIMKIEEDRLFLVDQRSERKYVMGGLDTNLAKEETKRQMRLKMEVERKKKEELRKYKAEETLVLSGSSDDELDVVAEDKDVDVEFCSETPSTSKNVSKKQKVSLASPVSQAVVCALDRTNISNRKAAYVLSAAAAQTHSKEELSKIPLSVSSIRRLRNKYRSQHAAEVKTQFVYDGSLVVHFDGKLLPAISGGPLKEDRIAILVSGYEMEKLLGIPKAEQGTGEQVSKVTAETLTDWNVQDQIVGMSFDTTSANTGRLNGACVLLEKRLNKKLLWLACRHHILELVCGDVFEALFGPTSGPNVLLFKRFQQFWPNNIKQECYESCSDNRLSSELAEMKTEVVNFLIPFLTDKTKEMPREDYKELIELTLIFLGKTPPRGVHFRAPGAFHHARWMAKLLYVLKIYLFRNQFKLTQHESKACLEFALFIVLVYVKFWLTSPNTCDAAMNDLNLIKKLKKYAVVSEVVSKKGIAAISRHLWYLSEELAPIGVFSDLVSDEIKKLMVTALKHKSKEEPKDRSVRFSRKADVSSKTLDYFVGDGSHLLFELLKVDTSFLEEDVGIWKELPSYQEAKRAVNALKVINDSAERGIALATTFNSTLTKQEDQKQLLFQVVESHRKRFPDTKKSTLLKHCNE